MDWDLFRLYHASCSMSAETGELEQISGIENK